MVREVKLVKKPRVLSVCALVKEIRAPQDARLFDVLVNDMRVYDDLVFSHKFVLSQHLIMYCVEILVVSLQSTSATHEESAFNVILIRRCDRMCHLTKQHTVIERAGYFDCAWQVRPVLIDVRSERAHVCVDEVR